MTKAEQITLRVAKLRAWMQEHHLQAYIFPSTDPHAGEYVPDHWKSREWISGFNGSAGTAVITLERAALWTDSRYWLAAEEQTSGTPFEVVRCSRNLVTPQEVATWLLQEGMPLEGSFALGCNAWAMPTDYAEELDAALRVFAWELKGSVAFDSELQGIELAIHISNEDPESDLWTERPPLPFSTIEIQPLKLAGQSASEKLAAVRASLGDADGIVITQLDEIAWLLNLRGSDVHCTPVFVSYLVVLTSETVLYVNPAQLTPEVAAYLQELCVRVRPYEKIAEDLYSGALDEGYGLQFDPSVTNQALAAAIRQANGGLYYEHPSPIPSMRAIKNEAEIAGFRSAMLKDGVAMVKFLRWLQEEMASGQTTLTEISIDRQLTSLRAKQPGFRDISFDTIAGYGAHAAIVHYEATPDTDIPLEPHGLLLLDSGAQYQDGTTDITRTIALGPLTEAERRDYTLVLKGHIRLATAVFPTGTTGTQLDVLARYAMWQEHKNYGHGTGHGVGSYLSVHEGPHQFRMNWMPAPLQAGMTVTIEPGIYIAGSHGCRTENTMLIVPSADGWLSLEPLTLCPIDTRPIVPEMMAADEIEYLNKYHARVREELMPLLDDEADRSWLREQTEPLAL